MISDVEHQRNTNQNYKEISPHNCQNDHHQKRSQITNVGKNVEKRELLYTVGRNVNWCSHYEKQYGVSSKKQKSTYVMIQQLHSCIYIQEKQKH